LEEKKIKKENRKLIPATFDPVFKALLCSEDSKEYLAYVISAITSIPYDELLKNMRVVTKELQSRKVRDKKMIIDIIVEDNRNVINLEMNKDYYKGLINKNNAYIQKLLSEQYLSGEDYYLQKKVIQINFDCFWKYKVDQTIIKFEILNRETLIVGDENYENYHINLPKLKNKYYNKGELSELEKRLLILIADNIEMLNDLVKGDDDLVRLGKKLEDINDDKLIIGLYDKEKEDEKVLRTKLRGAHEEGKEEGIKQGTEETKIQIAKNMLNNNIDILTISKVTGLKEEEINQLD